MSQNHEPPESADLFVSYARADKERVEPIVRLLECQGWSVWWDPDILPGQKFHDVIDRALAAARCVVVVWSEHSVRSDWVVGEASDAKQRGVLVPIRLDDARLRIDFRCLQTADFRDWTEDPTTPEARELCAGVARHLGEPVPAPVAGPTPPRVPPPSPRPEPAQEDTPLVTGERARAPSAGPPQPRPYRAAGRRVPRPIKLYDLLAGAILVVLVAVSAWFACGREPDSAGAQPTAAPATDRTRLSDPAVREPDERPLESPAGRSD